MYQLDVLTPPSGQPLTLAEAKTHLRVDGSEEDALITNLLGAATRQTENVWLWRALVTRQYRLTLLQAPSSPQVYLPMAPVQSVQTVTADGVAVTGFTLLGSTGILTLPTGTVITKQLVVEYTAGYGLAAAVPEDFKAAMLLMIGHWYENREAVVLATQPAKLPLAIQSMLLPYRAWRPE
jgi:uncharacterized phiE125 gp8 family phage protein